MEHSDQVLEKVALAAHLREGPAGVEAFLRQVYRETALPLADLARRLGWPVPVTAAVRGELDRAGLTARVPGGVALSAVGRQLAGAVLGLAVLEDALCPTCAGRRVVVDLDRWARTLACLEEMHRANPTVDTTLDQSHGTPETALRRALAMHHEGALEGRAVLILGDDDLVSVAIGLLALPPAAGGPGAGVRAGRLVVVDIDTRFLAHIAAAGERHGFTVETVAHDVRAPLPEALRAAFDTVETDPPYTLPGLRLFLSRAREALRPGVGHDLFLSYAARDPAGQCALLRQCVDLGLAPYSVTPDFNRYAGAGTLGGSSQLVHLRTTDAVAQPAGPYDGPLYTMDERPARRTYRCLACAADHVVGPGGDFATIEALVEQGCPRCGGRRFRSGKRTTGRRPTGTGG